AVPASVLELLTDQPGDHGGDVLIEVGAQHDDHAVDARFDLATEEGLAGVLPAAVVADLGHRPPHLVTVGPDTEVVQGDQAVGRGGPGLAPRFFSAPRREQRASLPLAVLALQGQQPGTPAFAGNAGALRRDV